MFGYRYVINQYCLDTTFQEIALSGVSIAVLTIFECREGVITTFVHSAIIETCTKGLKASQASIVSRGRC